MTDCAYDAWQIATACENAWNLPLSLMDALLEHEYTNHVDVEHVATIAPVDGNRIVEDEVMDVTQVGENGAILHDERGAVAMSVGHVQDVVDEVVQETDYIVIEVSDNEHYTVGGGEEA